MELFECKGCLDDTSFKDALGLFMIRNNKVATENGLFRKLIIKLKIMATAMMVIKKETVLLML